MLEFGDSIYYLDIEAFEKAVSEKQSSTTLDQSVVSLEEKEIFNGEGIREKLETIKNISPNARAINAIKYDMLRTFIEYLVDYTDVDPESLSNPDKFFDETSLGYKIIFNTLRKEKILKTKD